MGTDQTASIKKKSLNSAGNDSAISWYAHPYRADQTGPDGTRWFSFLFVSRYIFLFFLFSFQYVIFFPIFFHGVRLSHTELARASRFFFLSFYTHTRHEYRQQYDE